MNCGLFLSGKPRPVGGELHLKPGALGHFRATLASCSLRPWDQKKGSGLTGREATLIFASLDPEKAFGHFWHEAPSIFFLPAKKVLCATFHTLLSIRYLPYATLTGFARFEKLSP
jgi:hypothetical protein